MQAVADDGGKAIGDEEDDVDQTMDHVTEPRAGREGARTA